MNTRIVTALLFAAAGMLLISASVRGGDQLPDAEDYVRVHLELEANGWEMVPPPEPSIDTEDSVRSASAGEGPSCQPSPPREPNIDIVFYGTRTTRLR